MALRAPPPPALAAAYARDRETKQYQQKTYSAAVRMGRGEALPNRGLLRARGTDAPPLPIAVELFYCGDEEVQQMAAGAHREMDRIEHVVGQARAGADGSPGQDGAPGHAGAHGSSGGKRTVFVGMPQF